MANEQKRVFQHSKAARVATPAMIGLVGPSGSGKTRSALRLASGLQRVVGGDIWMIDTEAKRGLHHADKFDFQHLPFGAPFSPLDYLGAFEHCIKNGAKHIIVDSMSHEHAGVGGVLEMHGAEVERRAAAEAKRYDKARTSWGDEKHNFPAWSAVKPQRQKMINYVLQQECNFIFGFRAKPKTKMVRVKGDNGREKTELQEQGWQAIAGEEFLYEMLINFLLLPGAQGLPTYASEFPGECELIKVPEQFQGFRQKPVQLSEDVGEHIGRWCAGASKSVQDKPSANSQQVSKPQTKSADQQPAKTGASLPASEPTKPSLRFHPSFGEYGGQPIEGSTVEIRNEYDSWLDTYVADIQDANKRKTGQKALDDFRELNMQLAAEARLRSESAA
jgi:ABC-type cobalamin/Fe3+-siderophores transport system ATPase subunit